MLIPQNETPKAVPKFKVPQSFKASTPVQHTEVESNTTPSSPELALPEIVASPAALPAFTSSVNAAQYWNKFGFTVLPIVQHNKLPAVTWNSWENELTIGKITQHWNSCPFHDVGFIIGNDIIVFDADSSESIAALVALEKAHNVTPNMVSKTTKGEHHFYRRAKGTFAKSDAHSTKEHPDRLDVKTGRAVIILPPSTGKTLVICDARNASELVEVGQAFIDAVFRKSVV